MRVKGQSNKKISGSKKKKEKEKDLINTVKHVTYVTVYCNSLLEIIKI